MVAPGASATFYVKTTAVSNSTQTVALSVSGLPAGVTGTFCPTSVTAGGTSTFTRRPHPLGRGGDRDALHQGHLRLDVAHDQRHGDGQRRHHDRRHDHARNGVVLGSRRRDRRAGELVIAVPAGQTQLAVTIAGGTGDADLYVKSGAAPTLTTYDCRPYLTGNSETCTFTNPVAGNWYMMVNGYAAYSGMTITASYSATERRRRAIGNNVPVTNIAGATGSKQYWKITVPAGQIAARGDHQRRHRRRRPLCRRGASRRRRPTTAALPHGQQGDLHVLESRGRRLVRDDPRVPDLQRRHARRSRALSRGSTTCVCATAWTLRQLSGPDGGSAETESCFDASGAKGKAWPRSRPTSPRSRTS